MNVKKIKSGKQNCKSRKTKIFFIIDGEFFWTNSAFINFKFQTPLEEKMLQDK